MFRNSKSPYLSHCTRFKPKWIKGFNIRAGYTKPHRVESGIRLSSLGTRDNFLNRTPMAKVPRSTIDK